MGKFGLEEVLKNVNDYEDAVKKLSSRVKKKSKKKQRKRDKKRKQESSDSSSEEEVDELEQGKSAAMIVREMVAHSPQIVQELRELFRHVDNGEGVQTDGVSSIEIQGFLERLFKVLHLKRHRKGYYVKSSRTPSLLSLLSPILHEIPRESVSQQKDYRKEQARIDDRDFEHIGQHKQEVDPSLDKQGNSQSTGQKGNSKTQQSEQEHTLKRGYEEDSQQQIKEEVKRARTLGPSVPPTEVLQAAAVVGQEMERIRGEMDLEKQNDFQGGDNIGPSIEEIEADLGEVDQDQRTREVLRINALLAKTEQNSEKNPYDPFAILGVEQEAQVNEIKKKFLRLSVLVHPDKCQHELANKVFLAAKRAADDLCDSGTRSKIVDQMKKLENEKLLRAQWEQEERDRRWRVVRGTATAEDLMMEQHSKKGGYGKLEREEWMTQLPPAVNVQNQPLSQVSQTSFRSRDIMEQDVKGWMETPKDRLMQQVKEQNQQGLIGPQSGFQSSQSVIDQYVSSQKQQSDACDVVQQDPKGIVYTKRSLLEKHQEQQNNAKRSKKGKREVKNNRGDWEWRPFDREKDLEIRKDPGGGLGKAIDKTYLSNKFSNARNL